MMEETRSVRAESTVGRRPDRAGFSLVEMMIIIVIIGILATVAGPPMYRYLQSNRLQTGTDRMVADLQYARSLSIANGDILRFAATAGGYSLTDPVSGTVYRQRNFEHGMQLGMAQTADFFPWGMADATVFNLSNTTGGRQVNLLPTGIVEVN